MKNAFEGGMLIEDTRCQQWIPNADHFNSSRGYITHEDAVNHTQFWHDYISTDLKHRFSAQLRHPVLRDSVLTSLRFLVTALGRYSNNVSLVEKFEIIFNSQQQPIAIYAHLALPQWRADNFDIFQYFGFGHNTSVLGMASAVREGVVRPSSCDAAAATLARDKATHPPSSTNLFLGIRFSQFDIEQRIYILAKPTRDFAKARPIVHYSTTAWARKLGSAISTLLIKILNTVFRSILEFPDKRAVIEGIRRLFTMESFAESAHCLHQADIAGFYNQVQLSGILMSLCLSCTRMHRKPNKV